MPADLQHQPCGRAARIFDCADVEAVDVHLGGTGLNVKSKTAAQSLRRRRRQLQWAQWLNQGRFRMRHCHWWNGSITLLPFLRSQVEKRGELDGRDGPGPGTRQRP